MNYKYVIFADFDEILKSDFTVFKGAPVKIFFLYTEFFKYSEFIAGLEKEQIQKYVENNKFINDGTKNKTIQVFGSDQQGHNLEYDVVDILLRLYKRGDVAVIVSDPNKYPRLQIFKEIYKDAGFILRVDTFANALIPGEEEIAPKKEEPAPLKEPEEEAAIIEVQEEQPAEEPKQVAPEEVFVAKQQEEPAPEKPSMEQQQEALIAGISDDPFVPQQEEQPAEESEENVFVSKQQAQKPVQEEPQEQEEAVIDLEAIPDEEAPAESQEEQPAEEAEIQKEDEPQEEPEDDGAIKKQENNDDGSSGNPFDFKF